MKSKSQKNNNGTITSSAEAGLREQIEKRAHEIWVAGGCRHGEHVMHWLRAEREVLMERSRKQEQKSSTNT